MPTIIVTTASDTVDAGDGKTSLREALGEAVGKGHTDILFDAGTFSTSTTLQLAKSLEIAAGTDVTLDGSSGMLTQTITLDGSVAGGRIMTITQGASVTLRDLAFDGGSDIGKDGNLGQSGKMGEMGSKPPNIDVVQPVPMEAGRSGDGTDGTAAPVVDQMSGTPAAGGIFNSGTLVLERVSFARLSASGGYGGDGGRGGLGGNGEMPQQINTITDQALFDSSNHFDGWEKRFGYGGDAGKGGAGAIGGKGGDAAGAIFNNGTILLRDVEFVGNTARGGNGGNGGDGGSGGLGGRVYESYNYETGLYHAGFAGAGGDGGAAGNGGSAASAILNRGTIQFESAVAAMVYGEEQAGVAGFAGQGGQVGLFPILHSSGPEGKDGLPGSNGETGTMIGTSIQTVASTFIIQADKEHLQDQGAVLDRSVIFMVKRFGDNTSGATVHWRFAGGDGVTGADFAGGLPKDGVIEFAPFTSIVTFALTLNDDNLAEADEHFTIRLSTDSADAAIGWTGSSDVTIDGTLAPPIVGTMKDDKNVRGTNGEDTLNGLNGDDTLNGKGGADRLNGGSGSDTATYVNAKTGITASLAKASSNTGEAKGDVYLSIENLTGGRLADTLTGNLRANIITGNAGNDKLTGGKGGDALYGGNGLKSLGNDTFVYTSVSDSTVTKKGQDTIYDFSKGDHFDLRAIDANGKAKRNAAFDFIGTEKFSGHSGELRYDKDKSDTYVYADTNGDRKADFAIHLDDAVTLLKGDFFL